jgi:lysophospholipase L1-like esterase
VAFGDSITAGEVTLPIGGIGGLGATRQIVVPSASYPSQLKNLLAARYTLQVPSIIMTNEGVSGERAENAVARFARVVASERPQVVLLMHGYNNIGNASTLTATALQVNAMAAEGRNRQARVFIAALVPSRQGLRGSIPNSVVSAYNDRIRDVARGEGAIFVDLYDAMIANVDLYIGGDGLHPNELGYKKMAEVFLAAIQANLEVR